MNKFTQTLFSNWGLMRWIRLALGTLLAIQAYQLNDALPGLLAAFLLFQALTNTGCCGANGCALPLTGPHEKEEPIFKEIKNKDHE